MKKKALVIETWDGDNAYRAELLTGKCIHVPLDDDRYARLCDDQIAANEEHIEIVAKQLEQSITNVHLATTNKKYVGEAARAKFVKEKEGHEEKLQALKSMLEERKKPGGNGRVTVWTDDSD